MACEQRHLGRDTNWCVLGYLFALPVYCGQLMKYVGEQYKLSTLSTAIGSHPEPFTCTNTAWC